MKIFIDLKTSINKEKGLTELRKLLTESGINISSEIHQPAENEMGGGLAAGIAAILSGGFFGKLGEAIVRWVENYRSDIKLKNRFGEEIEISAKMKKKEIMLLIEKFMQKTEQKEKQTENQHHTDTK